MTIGAAISIVCLYIFVRILSSSNFKLSSLFFETKVEIETAGNQAAQGHSKADEVEVVDTCQDYLEHADGNAENRDHRVYTTLEAATLAHIGDQFIFYYTIN